MFIYYILITLTSLLFVFSSYLGRGIEGRFGNETVSRFGDAALNLLRVILLAKPLMMIMCNFSEVKVLKVPEIRKYILTRERFSFEKLKNIFFTLIWAVAGLVMKYRRLLGITVFILAFTHGGIHVANRLSTGYGILAQWQSWMILTGYISLLFLLVGYLTSNNFSIRLFKNKRIWIQKSAYLALLFVILHLMFLNAGEYRVHVFVLGIYIYLKLVEKKTCAFIIKPPQPIN